MSAILQSAKYWKDSFYKRAVNCEELTLNEKTMVREYWGGYYPENIPFDFIFHKFYKSKSRELFEKRIIPVDLYYCYIDPYFNNWNTGKIINNKALFPQLFRGIKQPDTFLTRRNNIWTNGKGHLVSKKEIDECILDNSELIIKKANYSEGGSGINFINGEDKIDKFWEVAKIIDNDLVVQESVKQNLELSKVNTTSINTIRILSLLNNDSIKIYSAFIRMGINNNRVDNLSQGGIACGIESNGKLKGIAYNWKGDVYLEHPTNGIKFNSITIPNYEAVCDLVKKAHPLIPEFRLVSWDIAINEEGVPILIEANLWYGELNMHQLTNGPLFGNDTDKILYEVFKK